MVQLRAQPLSMRLPINEQRRWCVLLLKEWGREEKLRSLKSVQIERIGHTYSIEQSECPEGPWLANYEQVTEVRDYAYQRLRRATQTRSVQSPQWGMDNSSVV